MLWWASILRVADAHPGPSPFSRRACAGRTPQPPDAERYLVRTIWQRETRDRPRPNRIGPAAPAMSRQSGGGACCVMVGEGAGRVGARRIAGQRGRRRAARASAAATSADGVLGGKPAPGASDEVDCPGQAIRPRADASADLGRGVAVDLERERNLNHLRRLPGHDLFLQLDRPCASLRQYVETRLANQAILKTEHTNDVHCDARCALATAEAKRPATAWSGSLGQAPTWRQRWRASGRGRRGSRWTCRHGGNALRQDPDAVHAARILSNIARHGGASG